MTLVNALYKQLANTDQHSLTRTNTRQHLIPVANAYQPTLPNAYSHLPARINTRQPPTATHKHALKLTNTCKHWQTPTPIKLQNSSKLTQTCEKQ